MPKNRPEKIKEFLLANIPDHSRDIVPLTAKRFKVTPTTVHRHLNKLLKQGEVIKTGRTRGAAYFLNTSLQRKFEFPIEPGLEEHQVWMDYFHEAFSILPENVYSICNYAFGEMLNNAIDHSQGTTISVKSEIKGDILKFEIWDDGIGIFKKVKNALDLGSERESVLELTKGKFTTDPDNHTGEGIYFTSRAVDRFILLSSNLDYLKDNLEDDWFIETPDTPVIGTGVELQIHLNSNKKLEDVFRQYSTLDQEEGIRKFDKTHIIVKLSKLNQDRYVSRSQAKRIMTGLEKFNHIVLDFRDIKTVGQGFVDEVFRIFQNKHPKIKIEYTNANEDVRFMIERGLPNKSE
jgi:anti-sigma regulatory factor (Ser/Thr protein kinase)